MKVPGLILAAALGVLAPGLASAASGYTNGELKKIDTEQGKVTLKHDPIDNLGMPGMTMVFRADAALVSRFKQGDLVKFKADRLNGALKVIELVKR